MFVDGQPHVEVAKRFGSTFTTLRRLRMDCHVQCRAAQESSLKNFKPAQLGGAGCPSAIPPRTH